MKNNDKLQSNNIYKHTQQQNKYKINSKYNIYIKQIQKKTDVIIVNKKKALLCFKKILSINNTFIYVPIYV